MSNINEKHKAFILAIEQKYFENKGFINNVTTYPISDFLNEVSGHLIIKRRFELETDPTYRQLIPYIVVCKETNDGRLLYFPYRRTQHGGEDRLKNKVSIGYGGHIDIDDVKYKLTNKEIYLDETIFAAAIREINEELTITDIDINQESYGKQQLATEEHFEVTGTFITANANEVDKVHAGIIVRFLLEDSFETKSNEDELELLEPMTAQQLLSSDLPLESWTELYLKSLI